MSVRANWNYPTAVRFGAGRISELAECCAKLGMRRPLFVTDAGLARLRQFLTEVPAERIKTPLKAADVPRLFTPETFCKVVIRAQRAAQATA